MGAGWPVSIPSPIYGLFCRRSAPDGEAHSAVRMRALLFASLAISETTMYLRVDTRCYACVVLLFEIRDPGTEIRGLNRDSRYYPQLHPSRVR
jgi:hypothetical protein